MSQSFLSRLPLSRFELDRDHLGRERPALFDELWANPATRILPIFQGSALLATPDSLALLPVDAVPHFSERVYLGTSTSTTSPEPAGTPIVAVELDDAGHLAESDWANLRQVGSRLSDRDAGLLTEALGILNWHTSHRFSPRTGEPTDARRCFSSGNPRRPHHPARRIRPRRGRGRSAAHRRTTSGCCQVRLPRPWSRCCYRRRS